MTETNVIIETREVPAGATRFVAETEFGDNGADAKTSPIKMLARSGQPLDHWFFGKIVHDMAGLQINKSRLPIDYCHNTDEIIGYLNHFNTDDGGLTCSGALTPFKSDDRAAEVIAKAKAGVPWEASIDWTGPAEIEELAEGQSATVNGQLMSGPMMVVRQWNLRGVAVCPYGADANTESKVLTDPAAKKTSLITIRRLTMANETEKPAEVAPASVEPVVEEVKPVEAAPAAEGVVEEAKPETQQETAPVAAVETAPDPQAEYRAELKKFMDKFDERGATWFAEGKTFAECQELYISELESTVKQLREAAPKASGETSTLSAIPADSKSATRLSDVIRRK